MTDRGRGGALRPGAACRRRLSELVKRGARHVRAFGPLSPAEEPVALPQGRPCYRIYTGALVVSQSWSQGRRLAAGPQGWSRDRRVLAVKVEELLGRQEPAVKAVTSVTSVTHNLRLGYTSPSRSPACRSGPRLRLLSAACRSRPWLQLLELTGWQSAITARHAARGGIAAARGRGRRGIAARNEECE